VCCSVLQWQFGVFVLGTVPLHTWQCVAVCCSVMQCVAVPLFWVLCHFTRGSMLQCVAVCCSVLQCLCCVYCATSHGVLDCFHSECCSVLQCVAVCCSVLPCVAVCCSMLRCVEVPLFVCTVPLHTVCLTVFIQSVAVCCRVLQCLCSGYCATSHLAVCCSVLQCVAVCCRAFVVRTEPLHRVCSTVFIQSVAVCCRVLQCLCSGYCATAHLAVCCSVLQCVAMPLLCLLSHFTGCARLVRGMGWLQSVGSINLYVSFAEYHLFNRALLQKRPIILSILPTKATHRFKTSPTFLIQSVLQCVAVCCSVLQCVAVRVICVLSIEAHRRLGV